MATTFPMVLPPSNSSPSINAGSSRSRDGPKTAAPLHEWAPPVRALPRLHTTHVESSEVLFGIPYLRGSSVCIINGVLDGSKKHAGREKRGCVVFACYTHSPINSDSLAWNESISVYVWALSSLCACVRIHRKIEPRCGNTVVHVCNVPSTRSFGATL